jgi:Rieske Fe-S protein
MVLVRALRLVSLLSLAGLAACDTGPASKTMGPEPSAGPAPSAAPAKPREVPNQGPTTNAPTEGVLRLGSAIDTKASAITLGEVAKTPDTYVGKTFTTTGTVTAVCQHMGCWMEIEDDASAAHIKMAGHAFFVPKSASGRKARVMATLVKADAPQAACEGRGHDGKSGGCRAEAENQLGRPLAKLELVAQGVELM